MAVRKHVGLSCLCCSNYSKMHYYAIVFLKYPYSLTEPCTVKYVSIQNGQFPSSNSLLFQLSDFSMSIFLYPGQLTRAVCNKNTSVFKRSDNFWFICMATHFIDGIAGIPIKTNKHNKIKTFTQESYPYNHNTFILHV